MVQRFYVETLGCPKNDVDSDKLVGALLGPGNELGQRLELLRQPRRQARRRRAPGLLLGRLLLGRVRERDASQAPMTGSTHECLALKAVGIGRKLTARAMTSTLTRPSHVRDIRPRC